MNDLSNPLQRIWQIRAAVAVCLAVLAAVGCDRWIGTDGRGPLARDADLKLQPASLQVRAKRRAFDGAPPVIPHAPLGADCTRCHTATGKRVPPLGIAPANPHLGNPRAGAFKNCRQCHVFNLTPTLFVKNTFRGIPQRLTPGPRAFAGAPPVIPHAIFLRENCRACHSGPAARREILCTHAERANCRQCHLANEKFLANGDGSYWEWSP